MGDVNRELLADAGVLWPELGLPFAATNDLLDKTDSQRETAGVWAGLDRAVRQHEGDAVFSNELLATLPHRQIVRLVSAFAPAEVHVVVTARDLARVLASQWQTTLKNGGMLTWPQFATAICFDVVEPPPEREFDDAAGAAEASARFWRRQDLPAIVAKWREAVGTDRITLVPVPPAGSARRIVEARFASAIGVESDAFTEPEYGNSSVGAYSAELIRRVNVQTAGIERVYQRMGVRNALARHVLTNRAESEPRCALSAEQLAWLQKRSRAMISKLAQWDVRVVGHLDDLVPDPDVALAGIDPTQASDAELLSAAVFGLAGMARVITDVRLEHDQLRRDHENIVSAREGLRDKVPVEPG